MNLGNLLPLLEKTGEFQTLVSRLAGAAASAESVEMIEAARPYALAALQAALGRPVLVITSRPDYAKQLHAEVQTWSIFPDRVFSFAEPEPLLYERLPWSPETISMRLSALSALSGRDPSGAMVIATARALLPRTAPPGLFKSAVTLVRRGETLGLEKLLNKWVELGYEPQAVVETPGTFSRRGGIVDIWASAESLPVRIEFIGDQVESLRRFDPATQRSREMIEHLVVTPASEALLGSAPLVLEALDNFDLSTMHPVAATSFRLDMDELEQRRRFRGIEFYLPYFYPEAASVLEYLPANGLVVIDDWGEVEATSQQFEAQAEQVREDLEARGEIPAGLTRPYFSWEELRRQLLGRPRLLLDYQSPAEMPRLPFLPSQRYGGQLQRVVDELLGLRAARARVVVVSRQSERISGLLKERDVFINPMEQLKQAPEPGHIVLLQGALSEGWRMGGGAAEGEESAQLPAAGNGGAGAAPSSPPLYLLTDAEIFGWQRPRPRRLASRAAVSQTPEAFFADLEVGDYVVHVDHGIGMFKGLQKMELAGPEREYLLLEYAHGDRLYVPVHQIDRLSRYVAPGGQAPTLHRLGTAEWSQIKERTQKAVADIARELLELYAAREVVTGHAYSPDGEFQHEFEASFPYVETPDQLQAIEQVKEDMEKNRPMDRLVVGDVGYGKTEVALRAAFKAALDGKQVALLAPTTVLAQQHYNTFRERLRPYPVTVEMLSRFRSDKEQREIIGRLRTRGVDIVIGTHRLLSKDVEFNDLGLLIIDEEQRFGVAHKERLKQLRQQVDVLTLTATPIPRTLYMSMQNVRDMSTIATPPEERQPIRTYVTGFDERLVRDAILRELDRGGQVFFVHNRVRGIGIIANQLQKLVPEARIAVGHGQMPEDELEEVMAEFAAGKYDVLVCTTIIESGIDIPNANTIIVNNADKFGLAQLYQLRGRVGRSTVRAFGYFLFDKRQELSDEARARLQTIAEASELGAGFQIAMRDLEIRGAGDILGARQSGQIAAVGFELYCRLLNHAIEEQRVRVGTAEEAGAREDGDLLTSPVIELPVPAQIPEDYIPDAGLRLRLYRRMAGIAEQDQAQELAREFNDRFGPLPPPARNLIYLLGLKLRARRARVAAISMEEEQILVRFREDDLNRMEQLSRRIGPRVRVARDRLWLPGPSADKDWQAHLLEVVQAANQKSPPSRISNGGSKAGSLP